MWSIRHAETDDDILACHPVVAQLRPHLQRQEFVARVQAQAREGYRLLVLAEDSVVLAVAGYRLLQNLAWHRFLYVDDLVTTATAQGRGHGRALMEWLIAEGRRQGCQELHLDSGVQKFGAHRFYLARGLDITCHHFACAL